MNNEILLLKQYIADARPDLSGFEISKVSETSDGKWVVVSFAKENEQVIGTTLAIDEKSLEIRPVMEILKDYGPDKFKIVYENSSDASELEHGVLSNLYNKAKSAVSKKVNGDGTWKSHKYIDRVKTSSGGWRYIYEQKKNNAKSSVSNYASKARARISVTKNKVSEKADRLRSKGKSFIERTVSEAKQSESYKKVSDFLNSKSSEKVPDDKTIGMGLTGALMLTLLAGIIAAKAMRAYIDYRVDKKGYKPIDKDNPKAMYSTSSEDPMMRPLTNEEQERFSKWKPAAESYSNGYTDDKGVWHPWEGGADLETIFRQTLVMEEASKDRNPNYPWGTYDTNCPSCALTYEAVRRGIDCQAGNTEGTTIDNILEYYDGEEVHSVNYGSKNLDTAGHSDYKMKKLENELMEYEDGARGCIAIYYDVGGGHIFNWEKQHGEIYYIDVQVGAMYTYDEFTGFSDPDLRDCYAAHMVSPTYYFRTDTTEITDSGYKLLAERE